MAITVPSNVGNLATTGSTVALNGLVSVTLADIIVIAASGFANVSSISGYGVTTWAKVNPPNQGFTADANHNDCDFWWGTVDGTPSANGTVTFGSATAWMSGFALRVVGAAQTVDTSVSFANDASATTDTKTITTLTDNCLIVSCLGFFNNVATTFTNPTGYTALTRQASGNSSTGCAYLIQTTHGASSMNWTALNNTGSNFPSVGGVAIKVAGAAAALPVQPVVVDTAVARASSW